MASIHPAALLVSAASVYTTRTPHDAAASGAIRLAEVGWRAPQSAKRCDWIATVQKERDAGKPLDALKEQYETIANDPNTFYRGTAHIFCA